MESTGSYWQNLFATLQEAKLEVILVNAMFSKNPSNKKTDVKDYRWLQKLHSIGLLSGSFLPDTDTEQIRKQLSIDKKKHKRINKNTPKNMDVNLLGYQ